MPRTTSGIVEVTVGVAEGRHEDDGACGAGLVVVVDDLRVPDAGEDAVDVGGLGLIAGEEVAVVVVADVLLPEAGDAVEQALGGVGVAHVPVGDELHAVGVGEGAEGDVVVEEAHRLRVGFGVELVDGLDELLGADGFRGVEAAVDPDDCLALFGEGLGLIVGEAFGEGELLADVAVVLEVLHVLGRGDDGHVLMAAFGGEADVDELHAVGFFGELLEVLGFLGVVDELEVVADVVAELLLGGGDVAAGGSGGLGQGGKNGQKRQRG